MHVIEIRLRNRNTNNVKYDHRVRYYAGIRNGQMQFVNTPHFAKALESRKDAQGLLACLKTFSSVLEDAYYTSVIKVKDAV